MTDDPKDELFGNGEPEKTEPRSILTPEEIKRAKAAAHERVEKALKEAEIERLIAAEMEKLRREEGRRTGRPDKDEPVTFVVDLAEFADRLRVNGEEFFHGYTYTKPRHVYDSLREIMFRGHLHQNTLDGKDLNHFYRQKQAPALSGTEVAS